MCPNYQSVKSRYFIMICFQLIQTRSVTFQARKSTKGTFASNAATAGLELRKATLHTYSNMHLRGSGERNEQKKNKGSQNKFYQVKKNENLKEKFRVNLKTFWNTCLTVRI